MRPDRLPVRARGALVALALLLALAGAARPARAAKLAFAPDDPRRLTGIYVAPFLTAAGTTIDPAPADGYSSTLSTLRLEDRAIGATSRLVLRFHNWGEAFPTSDERLLLLRNRWPVFTLQPRSISLAAIAAGAGDAWLSAQAAALQAAMDAARSATRRTPHAFLRFAHEMNGSWYPWSVTSPTATPEDYAAAEATYRAAFRRVHDVVAAVAPDVEMVWAPTWRSLPARPGNDMLAWYPGDAYVDWIGVTGYNRYASDWKTPADLFGEARALAAADASDIAGDPLAQHVGGSKPVMIAETSSVDGATDGSGRSKAGWLVQLRAYLAAAPDVRAVIWFDRSKRCADGTSDVTTCPLVYWRPSDGPALRQLPWEWNSQPAGATVFRALWRDPARVRPGPPPF